MSNVDFIGGFEIISPTCLGCGEALAIDNASMTDGCPCNSPLGVNNANETRWRLLMELQRRQARELEAAKGRIEKAIVAFNVADTERLKETIEARDEAEKWRLQGDDYGWNFHQGRSGGTIGASIIYGQVGRALKSGEVPA